MSTTVHKSTPSKIVANLKNHRHAANGSTDLNKNQNEPAKENMAATSKIAIIDIERENRLSKVISLFSKGLNQEEIARELRVDQSTVSRDLQYIKHEARIKIEMYLRKDILFEYVRYIAGSNEVTKHLWKMFKIIIQLLKRKLMHYHA